MSHSNPGTPNLTPPTSRFPWVATIIATVLGLAGLGFLGYAIFSVNETGEARAATPTQLVLVPTRVLAIPTTTPAPTSTTPAPTSAPTEAQATTPAPAGATLQITLPANVRSGPGTNYSIIGGLPVGSTPTVIGRDATAEWYVISDASLT
ncbi:MAG: SH3 domain-containing protein, partial [Anaerolineales bacterium]